MNIREELLRAIVRDPTPRQAGLHVTHLAKVPPFLDKGCERQVYYDLTTDIVPTDARGTMIFFRGKAYHLILTEHLRANGWTVEQDVNGDGYVGRFDAYKDGVLLDFKSGGFVPRDEAQFKQYFGHYIAQVQIYAALLTLVGITEMETDQRDGTVLRRNVFRPVTEAHVVFLGFSEDKADLPDLKPFPVPINTTAFPEILVKAKATADRLNRMALMGERPKRAVGWPFPCGYCAHLQRCFNDPY